MGITPKQFAQLQARAQRRTPVAVAGPESQLDRPQVRHEVLLGVDPSLRGTGFGVIRHTRPAPSLLAAGTIHCPAGWERTRCLAKIAQELREVIRTRQPTVCVVEGLFYAQNLQTALIMGEARGAALSVAAEAGLPVYEIAPRKVKQAVVGYGAAQKTAVAKMVQRFLGLTEALEPDAADALALAITFLQEQGRYSLNPPKRL